jgi:hypothetical protein
MESMFTHFSTADQKQPVEPTKATKRIIEAVEKTGMMARKMFIASPSISSDCLNMLREQINALKSSQ